MVNSVVNRSTGRGLATKEKVAVSYYSCKLVVQCSSYYLDSTGTTYVAVVNLVTFN
eukprot:SAG11_NODE_6960_length_1219_cov_1.028571_1_plen_55_part_01